TAGHAQRISASGRYRHRRFIRAAKANDLAGLDELDRLEGLGGSHQIAIALLVVGAPARFPPFGAERRARIRIVGQLVVVARAHVDAPSRFSLANGTPAIRS